MKEMRSVSEPKTMSHMDCNTQQATAVKENHNKAPAGSNQTLGGYNLEVAQ
jgi:hypothetical protein